MKLVFSMKLLQKQKEMRMVQLSLQKKVQLKTKPVL